MARPGLDRHPKFRLLVRLLNEPEPHVLGYLEMLWMTAYENGDPVIGDNATVEAVAKFPGKAGALTAALLACAGAPNRAGFIEPVAGVEGVYQIHDLFHHAPEYVKKRQKRETERRKENAPPKKRRTTADNGRHRPPSAGQRRTTAENGAPPAPAPAPAPIGGISSPLPPPEPAPPADARERGEGTTDPPDELAQAVAEVGAADPTVNRALIRRVCKNLRDADPPYTAAEVRALPAALTAHGLDFALTPSAIEKHIGRVRVTPPTRPPLTRRPAAAPGKVGVGEAWAAVRTVAAKWADRLWKRPDAGAWQSERTRQFEAEKTAAMQRELDALPPRARRAAECYGWKTIVETDAGVAFSQFAKVYEGLAAEPETAATGPAA
jgi:hypothetical protein